MEFAFFSIITKMLILVDKFPTQTGRLQLKLNV